MTSQNKQSKKRPRLIGIVIAVVIVVALIAILPGVFNAGNKGTTITETSLKKAVSINKLSTAEFTYEGIAEKLNDRGEAVYHIYYKATATSGMDLSSIEFKIDQGQKTVTPILPEVSVYDPVVDESAIEYLPKDANIDLREVIEICKQDALNEVEKAPSFRETSARNMRSTIEALLVPLLESNGYSIVWDNESTSDNPSDIDKAQDLNGEEGGNNESDQ